MLKLLETVPLEYYMCQRVIHAYCANFGQIYALGGGLGAICAWVPRPNSLIELYRNML